MSLLPGSALAKICHQHTPTTAPAPPAHNFPLLRWIWQPWLCREHWALQAREVLHNSPSA